MANQAQCGGLPRYCAVEELGLLLFLFLLSCMALEAE